MKNIYLLLVYSLFLTAVKAQTWQDTVALINTITDRYTDGIPGVQLAISRNGQIIYSIARGKANLEYDVPLTKETKIEAGSISKQFTAACILLLQQQGKLSLQDDIRKYVPEVPDYGTTITIQHLMNHTSGLKDWGAIAEIAGWPRGTKAYNNNDALQIIAHQKTLNNKPGDEYIYSNSNYNLMAIIIRRVSGQTLAEFSRQHIFIPAGMTHTEWRDDYTRVVPNRATAYGRNEKGNYYTDMPNENVYGNGGLLTTAEDLLIWNNYYESNKLGNPGLFDKQIATVKLNNGKKNTYAAGLMVDSVNGWYCITHSGATAGYRANLEYFPELGISIAWLSNNSNNIFSGTPYLVRNLLAKNKTATWSAEGAKPNHHSKSFSPYMGAYKSEKTNAGLVLYMKGDSIYSLTNGWLQISFQPNTLLAGRGHITFTSSKPRKAILVTASGDTLQYIGVEPADTSEKTLEEYVGSYYSQDADVNMKVVLKKGKLVCFTREGREEILKPVYKDGFGFDGGDIFIDRDKQGKINTLYISISRARKVPFSRIP